MSHDAGASSSRPSKKRAKPSKSSKRSSEEEFYWQNIEHKEVMPTKFFDAGGLRELGLEDFVSACLINAGLKGFHRYVAYTHAAMTKEFLMTLQYEFSDDKVLKWLSFEYQGQRHTMSAEEVREVFCISGEPCGTWGADTVGDRPTDWWFAVTGKVHGRTRDTYNSDIPNPALVLCQKVLAMTFFGKGEVNKVPRVDLQYLWCLAPECPLIPDWAGIFVNRCHNCRSKSAGKIAMGGMISLLVRWFVDIVPLEATDSPDPIVRGGHSYTTDWLTTHRAMLKLKNRREWIWPFGDGTTFIHLPKHIEYGPSPTWLLPADDVTGMEVEDVAGKKKLTQRQRRRVEVTEQEHVQEEEEEPEQEEQAFQQSSDAGNWDRLWTTLQQSNATATERYTEIIDRLGRVELHVQSIDQNHQQLSQEVAGIREGQTRAHGYWEEFYNYEKGQWEQYWVQNPPPPPPGQY